MKTTTDIIARRLMLTLLALQIVIGGWAQTSYFSMTNNNNVFTITRDNTTTVEQVKFRTVSVSALAGKHFYESEGVLNFGIGEDTKQITVAEVPIQNIPLLYKYQRNNTRSYRLELLDMGGFHITERTRNITYSNIYNFTNNKVIRTVTDLVYINGSKFASGVSSSNYVDVSYDPSTNSNHTMVDGYIMIDDEYAYNNKTACVVNTSDLINATGATREYHNVIGNKMYATVCFTEKEENDGYAYIQILADRNNYDGEDPNGEVHNPSYSLYKACHEMYKGSHVYNSDGKQFFPHRYDYHDRSEETAHNVSHTSFCLPESYLWQQKFKSSDNHAANSGSLVLAPTVNNIYVRFDAGGKDNDTYYVKNLFVRLIMCDEIAPNVLTDDIKVVAGDHKNGNIFLISIPFNEIVRIAGSSKYLRTTWGDLSYVSGDGTNVLTFKGYIDATEGTTLQITGHSFQAHDQSGNDFTGSVVKTFANLKVEASYNFSIKYDLDGGNLAVANPETYNHESETFILNNPTLEGYDFLGWTGSNGNTPQLSVKISNGSHGDRYYKANWSQQSNDLELLNGYTLVYYDVDSYRVSSLADWNALAAYIEAGHNCEGLTFMLTEDIEGITSAAGDNNNAFSGTILGDGHTMTLNIVNGDSFSALIHTSSNATFADLTVAGSITTDKQHVAGFVGHAWGTNTFRNCTSSVTIISGIEGDGTHAGFVAEQGNISGDAISFTDCVFNGKILTTNGTHSCAGFVGWVNKELSMSNCLYAPAAILNNETEVLAGSGDNMTSTFARPYSTTIASTCYYTRTLGHEQGALIDANISDKTLSTSVIVNNIKLYVEGETAIEGVEAEYTLTEYGAVTVNPTVTFNGSTLDPENYSVTYTLNNHNVTSIISAGTYILTVTGNNENNYYGSKSITFSVVDGVYPPLAGNGTKDDPYLIGSAANWKTFTDNVNTGGKGTAAYYKLTNDITLGSAARPLNTVVGTKTNPFSGTLDGDFHTIHLTMERHEIYAALFGITDGATIMNVSVDGTITTNYKFAGALIAYANNSSNNKPTTIINCISSVHIVCDGIVTIDPKKPGDCTHGGFVGQNEKGATNFENCLFDGWIKDSQDPQTANKCTGFIGWVNNSVTYTNCAMAGTIDVQANSSTLPNSMASFHRLAASAKAYYKGYTYYINDYTYGSQAVQGTLAPTTAPTTGLAKIYEVNNTTYYIPGVVVHGMGSLNPTITFMGRALVENTDYTVDVVPINTPAKEDGIEYQVTVNGINGYGGSFSKVIKTTYPLSVAAWNDEEKSGWYAISSPVNDMDFADVTNLIQENVEHNIYRYDEATKTWQEYRNEANKFNAFENGRGYVYRTRFTGNIVFNGLPNSNRIDYSLTYSEEAGEVKGYNLVGNPYNHEISKGVAFSNDNLKEKYCILNPNGSWELKSDNTPIPVGAAFFIQTKEAQTIRIKDSDDKVREKADNDNIWFTVKNEKFTDVACIEFKEGDGLNKMAHYNENAPMLYFKQNGETYASVNVDDNTKSIVLCFKSKSMSRYTLNMKAEGLFSYLHLIDKLTGSDVDMLIEDSYSFISTSDDETDRFIVKFNYNGGDIANSDIFAYQNGSDIVVNGEGELQVFDITGRMIMSTNVNGVEYFSSADLSNGVFVFRLIGNEIKTQKIVVR